MPHPAAYFRDKGPRRESPYGRRAFRSKRDLPRPTLVGDSTKTRGKNVRRVSISRAKIQIRWENGKLSVGRVDQVLSAVSDRRKRNGTHMRTMARSLVETARVRDAPAV